MNVEQQPSVASPSRTITKKASPLASSIANRLHLDLGGLSGSGSAGQITVNDLRPLIPLRKDSLDIVTEKVSDSTKMVASIKASSKNIRKVSDQKGNILHPLKNIRRITRGGGNFTNRDFLHFYHSVDCETDSLLNFKRELGNCEESHFFINDLILYAVARALNKHPAANASWKSESIRIHNNVNLAVVIVSDNGLLTPVIRNAESKGILAIASEMKEFKERAKNGKLNKEELMGGTFLVYNLGMDVIQQAEAGFIPSQACILGVSPVETNPSSRNKKIIHTSIMNCTLSSDQRVIDDSEASRFLSCLKIFIEEPLQMLV